MSNRRWYNPHLPQTLVIAQLLLYFNAAFGLFDFLSGRIPLGWAVTHIGGIIIIAGIALAIYGAQGIANESKLGYQAAIAASLAPFVGRLTYVVQGYVADSGLRYVLFGHSILNAMFDYALVALLLHPMSSNHQKVWFR